MRKGQGKVKEKMKRGKWGFIALIVAALGIAVPLFAGGSQQKITHVQTVQAKRQAIVTTVHASGTLQPRATDTHSAPAAGVVASVDVRAGTRVKQGQLLMTLSSPELERALAQAQDELEVARQTLEASRQARAKARVQEATAMAQQGAYAYNEYRDAIDAYQKSLGGATFVWSDQAQGAAQRVTREQLEAQDALEQKQLDMAQSKVDELRAQKEQLTVVAQSDGVVVQCDVHKGAAVALGAPLATIARTADMQVQVSLNEYAYSQVQEGMVCTLTGTDLRTRQGMVTEIGSMIHTVANAAGAQKSGDVWIALDDSDGLVAGASVEVDIVVNESPVGDTVPLEALQGDETAPYVFVAHEERACKREVVIVARDGLMAQVVGLQEGDCVISPVPEGLKEGDHVVVDA
nr:efflux RND transporter periplasmic adaptor subunit [Maliibacterium massiliense]